MKYMKRILCFVLVAVMALSALILPTAAGSAYQTYVYDINGKPLYSPDAYTAHQVIEWDDMGLELELKTPDDIESDAAGNVYISDTGNNRIVVLDRYYKLKFVISNFTNDQGVADFLSGPRGVFVSEPNTKYNERLIWVCDTGASRIVVFNENGEFVKILEEPESSLFEEDSVYKPIAVAVDEYNRLYVVSSTTYQGIIVMTDEGVFTSFIGAQAVSASAWDILWRRFQTKEQRENSEQNISTEFNNITINRDKGLVYVTTSTIEESNVAGAITSKTGTYSPVKLLNANGTEIMRRNGFFAPAGEVDYSSDTTDEVHGVSTIIDAAVGPNDTWSIIDSKRNRVFTYDFDGNLLFAFGDKGNMLGNLKGIRAITYQGSDMLVLDSQNCNVTVYQRTEYGDILMQAINAESTQDFDLAISLWTEVLKRNSNFDSAYVGIGQAMFRDGEWANSLTYYEAAYDTDNWSDSYKELRTEWMADYFLVLILIVVALIVVVVLFFSTMNKINRRAATSGKKRHFGHELAYAFYVMFHPFDGFWDLKHEKRGSVRGGIFYIILTIAAFYYQAIGQGYLLNPQGEYSGFWNQALGVLVPLLLFVIGNWCLTTLFDGEGSFKDIFIAASYSLTPLPLLIIPATVYSNFVIATEVDIVGFISTLAFVWLALLLFFGTMVTHDYSMGKNAITVVGTILAMACIMFVAILFTTLIGKIVSLVTNIVTEIQFRM